MLIEPYIMAVDGIILMQKIGIALWTADSFPQIENAYDLPCQQQAFLYKCLYDSMKKPPHKSSLQFQNLDDGRFRGWRFMISRKA